jgi:hypothetical protein
MKRLLLLLDSDPMPNSYDIIVGYGGRRSHRELRRHHVRQRRLLDRWCSLHPRTDEKKHTAVFIGGANMATGEMIRGYECLAGWQKHPS